MKYREIHLFSCYHSFYLFAKFYLSIICWPEILLWLENHYTLHFLNTTSLQKYVVWHVLKYSELL